jgi:hypothetical protein
MAMAPNSYMLMESIQYQQLPWYTSPTLTPLLPQMPPEGIARSNSTIATCVANIQKTTIKGQFFTLLF